MSRGVRDLRDLICVSRLTVRESDDEIFSDDEDANTPYKEISRLSLTSDLADSKPPSPTHAVSSSRVVSPDSGFATNTSPGISSSNGTNNSSDSLSTNDSTFHIAVKDAVPDPLAPGTARYKSQKKKKRKKCELPLEPSRHPLPKPQPLPPVPAVPGSPLVSEHELFSQEKSFKRVKSAKTDRQTRVNFDDMMIYLDATLVANWLTRANTALEDMAAFCLKGDNFVQFCHFWLSQFPDLQKRDIFGMEFDFLIDEVSLAFAVGKENRSVVRRDILDLLSAVFKEYPVKLLSARGSHMFLDYLDTLISERQDSYRSLLSDVRVSTSNRQFAQWLLAIRSFALVNVWSSVMNFYRNLTGNTHSNPIHDLWLSGESIPVKRMLQAIKLGHIEVIHYLIVNGHVNPTQTDRHKKSFIFSSVMHNKAAVTKYLTKRVHPAIDVNLPAESGNTVLHAASNSGNLEMVEILCQCDSIEVNCQNPQCENATPLHLAVMHGHEKIVESLLKNGADSKLKMGNTTIYDLARDFDHLEIVQLLEDSLGS